MRCCIHVLNYIHTKLNVKNFCAYKNPGFPGFVSRA